MPLVKHPEPGLLRWTFASGDPVGQRKAFSYWRGWFGLEEDDEPNSVDGDVWMVCHG
ncbi:MAG TPA: hypothetical protein VGV07_22295 [Devosia sp.]|jgi:hypothetical protein|uniref:hypothetical protein n=1 Tax=Devosia sp. TaxID=1871048 RepID=UPI002DDCE7D2|nr:hypothetical protein [Devosia sp.]HEV2517999.1 hypothetical protein [Devosia sp.]